MKHVKLGGLIDSSKLGYGAMSLSDSIYKTHETFTDEDGIKLLHRVKELGINHIDSAIIYGFGHNEKLIGKFLKELQPGEREKLVITSKVAFDPEKGGLSGDPDFVRRSCLESLERFGVDYIDIFYLHRIDTSVPIETTMAALKKLVEEGKIRAIGLSEASANTIRRAHAVHPVTVIQQEWSLWTRDCEAEIIPTCRQLGIGIVAYSPLGRGALTGAIKSRDDLPPGDWRLKNPRFEAEAMAKNAKLVEKVEEIAARKGPNCTAAKLALAWVMAQGDDVVPIPGTAKIKNLEANVDALNFQLTKEEVEELSNAVPPDQVVGLRYDASHPTAATN